MMGGGMHGFGGLGGFGWPGMILGWVFNLVLIVGVILLVVWIVRRIGGPSPDFRPPEGLTGRGADPREILQARYARGEITRDQYREILGELSD